MNDQKSENPIVNHLLKEEIKHKLLIQEYEKLLDELWEDVTVDQMKNRIRAFSKEHK